jgi:putative DNA primase/helicase
MVGSIIGIGSLDVTTYDINRLMYWPSSSIDAEFVSYHNDQPFLVVDEVLGRYEGDWRDPTNWPRSEYERELVRSEVVKLGDPKIK